MKILLVDDDREFLGGVERAFQEAGFETSCAHDGAEALEAARTDPPDLIVSEVLLPSLDGFSLLRCWITDPVLRRVPFTFFTGVFARPSDEALARSLGAYRFWRKPMDPQELVERVDEVVQLRRQGMIGEPAVPPSAAPQDLKPYDPRLVLRLRLEAQEAREALGALHEQLKDAGPLLVGVEIPRPGEAPEERLTEERRSAAYRISEAAQEATNLDELFRAVHGILATLMDAAHFTIDLQDGEPETLSLGGGGAEDPPLPPAVARGLIRRVVQSGAPLLATAETLRELEGEGGGRSFSPPGFAWMGVPLGSHDRVIGALALHSCSEGARYGREDLEVFSFVSTQVAMAIQRKRDEAEMLLLTSAVEQAGEAIFIVDHEGRFVYVNPAFEEQSGYSRGELAGSGLEILRDAASPGEDFEELLAASRGGSVWSRRMTLARVGAEPYIADVTLSPVRNDQGDLAACVFVLRDATREVEVQDQLQRARTFETVGMLAQGIAHEVRNPLFAINLNMAAMEKLVGQQTAVKPFLGFIQEQVQKLDVLMKDLVELGQPLGRDDFIPTTLQAVLKDAARQAEGAADAHSRLILELPSEPMPVRGVFGKLKLAFLHLFDNAFQNSPMEGRVWVRVEEDGASWIVRISDEGTGLLPDVRDRLFDPFVTTHEGHRGLGLTMVRHCLSAHSGTVTAADNAPGPGATFTVVLPKGTGVGKGPP